MTIALGFRFDHGILLSADSQYTEGLIKRSGIKIFPFELEPGCVIFGIAGSVAFATQTIRECVLRLRNLPEQERSLEEMRRVMSAVLTEHHQLHIYPHPQRGQFAGPDFQLLIAVWSHIDGMNFFYTTDTAINPVPSYYCLGAGSDLAHFLIRNTYRHSRMTVRDIANIAIHILRETKEWVEYCGGTSQFAVLHDDGSRSEITTLQIEHSEAISEAFRQATRRLYVVTADLEADDARVRGEVEGILMILEAARNKRKSTQSEYENFITALGRRQPNR